MTRYNLLFLAFIFSGVAISGCDSVKSEDSEPLEAEIAADIAADQPGRYTFYNLRTGEIVPAADSASNKWDIAFLTTTIFINGGTSGPGQGEAQVLTGLFEDFAEAPAGGYAADTEEAKAIPTGSGNGWYNYSGPPNHLITPLPGRVIMVRTGDGRYAKVRILSYYKGNPATLPADATAHPAQHYTFEYVFQPDGSRNLAID